MSYGSGTDEFRLSVIYTRLTIQVINDRCGHLSSVSVSLYSDSVDLLDTTSVVDGSSTLSLGTTIRRLTLDYGTRYRTDVRSATVPALIPDLVCRT